MPSAPMFRARRRVAAFTACLAAIGLLAACAPGSVEQAPAPSQPSASQPPGAQTGLPGPPIPDAAAQLPPPARRGSGARVAMLLPLSGENAPLGKAMLNAAQLALFDIADEDFTLLPFDTKGTAQGADAAAQLALAGGIDLILGPLFAHSVAAVANYSRPAGVPVVAFSNSPEVAGDGVYITGFVPAQQTDAILGYAAAEGLASFALLAPDNEFGHSVLQAARDFADRRGGRITDVVLYPPGANDLSEDVKRLARYDARHRALLAQREALSARGDEASRRALRRLEKVDTIGEVGFDAVLLPDGGQALRTIGSLLSYYDVDQPTVRYLGLSTWAATSGLGTEPSLIGGWFVAAPTADRDAFAERYREAFAKRPPRLASLAYDATALAAVLARGEGPPDYSRAALTSSDGFHGVDGIFRLTASGVVDRAFTVQEVAASGTRIRRPAPTTFDPPIN